MKTKLNRRKNRFNNKKLVIVSSIVLVIIVVGELLLNSMYIKEKILRSKLTNMAEKYYTEGLLKVAKSYMLEKESISINLETLRNYGEDTSIFKNTKTGKKCTDVNTYVTIVIDKDNVKDWSKDYEVKKVVLDCFEK